MARSTETGRGVPVGLAVLACVAPPLIAVPFIGWLVAGGGNFWWLAAGPPLFGLGFLAVGRRRAYALTVAAAAGLPLALGALVWVVVRLVCAGSQPGDYCGLEWLFFGLLGVVAALLAVVVISAVRVHRAAATAR